MSDEKVRRRARPDADEPGTHKEKAALRAHIEKGFLQAERGELIDGAQARREIQALKKDWIKNRSSKRCTTESRPDTGKR